LLSVPIVSHSNGRLRKWTHHRRKVPTTPPPAQRNAAKCAAPTSLIGSMLAAREFDRRLPNGQVQNDVRVGVRLDMSGGSALIVFQSPYESIGRLKPARVDSRDTRARLIAAVGILGRQTGVPPTRLVDIANAAGISTATAYRHFGSAEAASLAHVLQLPQLAIDRFAERQSRDECDAAQRFVDWNEAWVHACIVFGPTAAALRSPEGFLARRRH
jgi:Bacterial regulatory proteins, tetR family